MKLRAWKYCRQSHFDDGLPEIQAQNEMIDAYIEEHGYILAGTTSVVEFGTQRNRESLHKLVLWAIDGYYDVLLVSDLDRFLVDTIPCMDFCRELLNCDVRIIPVRSGVELTLKEPIRHCYVDEFYRSRYQRNMPRGVTCRVCGKNPMKVQGCHVSTVFLNGKAYKRNCYLSLYGERCPDCNAVSGRYHHWGCKEEICPVCGLSIINCECRQVMCPTGKDI